MRGEIHGPNLALPMTAAPPRQHEWIDAYDNLERCPAGHEWDRPLLTERLRVHVYGEQITVTTRRLSCLCGEWSVLTGSFGDHQLEPRLSLVPIMCS